MKWNVSFGGNRSEFQAILSGNPFYGESSIAFRHIVWWRQMGNDWKTIYLVVWNRKWRDSCDGGWRNGWMNWWNIMANEDEWGSRWKSKEIEGKARLNVICRCYWVGTLSSSSSSNSIGIFILSLIWLCDCIWYETNCECIREVSMIKIWFNFEIGL